MESTSKNGLWSAHTLMGESKAYLDHIVRELGWEERGDFMFKTCHVFLLQKIYLLPQKDIDCNWDLYQEAIMSGKKKDN